MPSKYIPSGRSRGAPPRYLGKWNPVSKSYALEKKDRDLKFSKVSQILRERKNRTARGIKKDRSQKNARVLNPAKRADLLKIMYLPDVFRKYDVIGIDDGRTKASAASTKKKLKKAIAAVKAVSVPKKKKQKKKKLSYAAVVRKSGRKVRKPVKFGFA